MAGIVTNDDFVEAFEVWKRTHTLVHNGVNAADRMIYRLDPNPNPPPVNITVDVTPPLAQLETAMDIVLLERTDAQALSDALAALERGRKYLQDLLDNPTPPGLTTIVANIKNEVDNNVYLTRWMQRYLNAWSSATTLPVSMAPNTDPLRNRYILALAAIIPVRKPVS